MGRRAATDRQEMRDAIALGGRSVAVLAGCLLVAFWGSVGAAVVDPALSPLRALFGFAVVAVAPGVLLFWLLGSRDETFGRTALYGIVLSVGLVGMLSVAVSVLYPLVGIARPLSFLPVALTVSGLVAALAGLVYRRRLGITVAVPAVDQHDGPILAALAALPLLAIAAAHRMNVAGDNALMYVFLLLTAGVVLVSIAVVPRRLYPVAITSIAAAVFLHRNMITNSVVGSDIQVNYYVAQMLFDTGVWNPALGGVYLSLPTVTTVPATLSAVTGVSVAYVFKLGYSSLFALAPLGMYYAFRRPFGSNAAFVGGLFFILFFRTFYETPDKERIAQLFIVLFLLTVVIDRDRLLEPKWLGAIFGIGIVLSHYTTTFIFVFALVAGYVLIRAYRTFVENAVPQYVTAAHLAGFGVFAVGWYLLTSQEIITAAVEAAAGVPLEFLAAISGETVHRSGASAVEGETGLVYTLSLLVHMGLVALVGLGIVARSARLTLFRDRGPDEALAFTAIAIPMLGFLGASYFVAGELGVDRMYQITLIVLGPFMPLGFVALREVAANLNGRSIPVWTPLVVLMVALLLFNTGIAYDVADEEVTSDVSIDPDTHSLAYTDSERSGGQWIDTHHGSPTIYTDVYTEEMFRSIVPDPYVDGTVVQYRHDWHPYLEFSEGFVYVRERSVVADSAFDGDPPHYYLTESEQAYVERTTNKVYTNDESDVFRYDGEPQRYDRTEN